MIHLSVAQERLLFSLAARIVPESAQLDDEECERFAAIVDDALALRSAGMRRQLRLFLRLIQLGPVLRFGRRFTRCDPSRQDRIVRWFQDGPVGLFRNGTWGLKALVFMGYYGRPEVWPSIAYEPRNDGNQMLRGDTA